MGIYGVTCPNCGGPAVFFSGGPSIDCAACGDTYKWVEQMHSAQKGDYESYLIPKKALMELRKEVNKLREALLNCRVERDEPETVKYLVDTALT